MLLIQDCKKNQDKKCFDVSVFVFLSKSSIKRVALISFLQLSVFKEMDSGKEKKGIIVRAGCIISTYVVKPE